MRMTFVGLLSACGVEENSHTGPAREGILLRYSLSLSEVTDCPARELAAGQFF